MLTRTDPDRLIGTPIAGCLAPSDADVFDEATRQLQEDDSHTLEVQFRIKVKPEGMEDDYAEEEHAPTEHAWFREMEGKGMLMYDRGDGTPSHTMWVIKPLGPPELLGADGTEFEVGELEPGEEGLVEPLSGGLGYHRRGATEPVTPFPYVKEVPTGSILCRICELEIPSWFFVKHNDTCNESHRIEASVAECNEGLSELRNTVRELIQALDKSGSGNPVEYRGTPIFSPTPTPATSISQFFKPPLSARLQKASVRKLQHKLLTQIEEILQIALDISMPSLRDDQADEPIERQRLVSPESVDRISRVRTWVKPTTDDPALAQLVDDASMLLRSKIEEVNRLSNTVRYSEKVRQEWEDDYLAKQAAMVADVEAYREQTNPMETSTSLASEAGDASSTNSEYNFDADNELNSLPTPMRAVSPAPFRPRPTWRSPLIPINHLASTSHLSMSRSSTPPSVSSPLAYTAPIVASLDSALDRAVSGFALSPPVPSTTVLAPPNTRPSIQPIPISTSSTLQNSARGSAPRSSIASSSSVEPRFTSQSSDFPSNVSPRSSRCSSRASKEAVQPSHPQPCICPFAEWRKLPCPLVTPRHHWSFTNDAPRRSKTSISSNRSARVLSAPYSSRRKKSPVITTLSRSFVKPR